MSVTEQEVLGILRTEKRPLKARRIASILRTETGSEVTRTEVNRVLYAMQSRVLVTSDENHCWTVSGEAKYGT
jgi:repressor of nif and glnA expression